MNTLTHIGEGIPPMTDSAIQMVRSFEEALLTLPQVSIETTHVLHAGMYARSITIPAGCALAGVLIKVDTILISSGDVRVYVGDGYTDLTGYNVLPASAGRKQAFIAHSDTELTMLYPTQVATVAEAEQGFTDEADTLGSRAPDSVNHTTVTGD